MDQRISIKIADRTFHLSTSSPEQEEVIRQAADAVNRRLENYTRKNPGKTLVELMSMVALNECACRISFQRELDARKAEAQQLGKQMADYLDQMEK